MSGRSTRRSRRSSQQVRRSGQVRRSTRSSRKSRKRINWPALRNAARKAMRKAYAPYSNFRVGVAGLVDDGRIVTGCNVENASYGLTLCADCGLISELIRSGGGRLVALCSIGNDQPTTPCGRCRQLLWEHGGPRLLVEVEGVPVRLSTLIPHAFPDASAFVGKDR